MTGIILPLEWVQDCFSSLFSWCLITGCWLTAVSNYNLLSVLCVPTTVLKISLFHWVRQRVLSTPSALLTCGCPFLFSMPPSAWTAAVDFGLVFLFLFLTSLLFGFQTALRVIVHKCTTDQVTAQQKSINGFLEPWNKVPGLHGLAPTCLSDLFHATCQPH